MGLFKSLKKAVKDVGKFVKRNGPVIAAVAGTVVSGGAAAPVLAGVVSAGKKLLSKGGAVVRALEQKVAASVPANERPRQVRYHSALFSTDVKAGAPAPPSDGGGGGLGLLAVVGVVVGLAVLRK